MIKETITYNDTEGNLITEDFWFHLNQKELIDMELSVAGGMLEMIDKIIKSSDQTDLFPIFDTIIKKAYGVKSEDKKSFIKDEKSLTNFVNSEAYSNLFMKLLTDSNAASEFINGVIPDVSNIINLNTQKTSIIEK